MCPTQLGHWSAGRHTAVVGLLSRSRECNVALNNITTGTGSAVASEKKKAIINMRYDVEREKIYVRALNEAELSKSFLKVEKKASLLFYEIEQQQKLKEKKKRKREEIMKD